MQYLKSYLYISARSLGVMIPAFQAGDPGSIPGGRIFHILIQAITGDSSRILNSTFKLTKILIKIT